MGRGADEKKKAGRKNGDDTGDDGSVVFEPTVEEENDEESEKTAHNNTWNTNGVTGDTEELKDNFLQEMIGEVDEIAAKN